MKQGEVWLVRMDEEKSIGNEYYKDRPALVIIATRLVSSAEIITIMPFTSSLEKQGKNDLLVQPSVQNGLWMPSVLKVEHIYGIDSSRLIEKFGDIESESMKIVKKYILRHFYL
jgi:mRNA-degrading endonuclease toxin of MazEF toxin-antitoxin module